MQSSYLLKLAPLGTINSRFARLQAVKYACNKADLKIIKEYGGTEPQKYNCTLVAQSDVERYFDRYNNGVRTNRCSTEINDRVLGEKKQRKRWTQKPSIDNDFHASPSKSKENQHNFSQDFVTLGLDKAPIDKTAMSMIQTTSMTDDEEVLCKKLLREDDVEQRSVLSIGHKHQHPTEDDLLHTHEQKDDNFSSDNYILDVNSNIVENDNSQKIVTQLNIDKVHTFSNDNEEISPHKSPGLLLKRVDDNQWHVANEASIHDVFMTEEDSVNISTAKVVRHEPKLILKRPRKRKVSKIKSSTKMKTVDTLNERLGEKNVGNKDGRKKQTSKQSTIPLQTLEKDDNIVEDYCFDKDLRENRNGEDISFEFQTEHCETKDLNSDTTTKNPNKLARKKRQRCIEENSFCLIDTIPYPPSLFVKNGELCPTYTMVYNQKNRIPGSCHALWRWRLGKPVKNQILAKVQDERVKERTRDIDELNVDGELSSDIDCSRNVDKFSTNCITQKESGNSKTRYTTLIKSPEEKVDFILNVQSTSDNAKFIETVSSDVLASKNDLNLCGKNTLFEKIADYPSSSTKQEDILSSNNTRSGSTDTNFKNLKEEVKEINKILPVV